ncbi:MAG: hypothetical protein J3K34DRAFT_28773 [Monoraphidium minutum]|nr:MAG: hypothetical protein J3K34DRAFT_28773 [Monoraphidium minutum]
MTPPPKRAPPRPPRQPGAAAGAGGRRVCREIKCGRCCRHSGRRACNVCYGGARRAASRAAAPALRRQLLGSLVCRGGNLAVAFVFWCAQGALCGGQPTPHQTIGVTPTDTHSSAPSPKASRLPRARAQRAARRYSKPGRSCARPHRRPWHTRARSVSAGAPAAAAGPSRPRRRVRRLRRARRAARRRRSASGPARSRSGPSRCGPAGCPARPGAAWPARVRSCPGRQQRVGAAA